MKVQEPMQVEHNSPSFREYNTTFVETESSGLSDDLQSLSTHLNTQGIPSIKSFNFPLSKPIL
jgi:hypothetical protein|tara:strand:- start:2066 stop:2254 length:189 start_codon:yes stop_codon:yes gene_type:complete